MLQGPVRLSVLAALLAFGATGMALAVAGLGMPFIASAALAAIAAGVVMYGALRQVPPPDRSAEQSMADQIETFRTESSALRHDMRGVLSPALMMSDRLLKHPDAAVQRAGQAVVRSIERATALLASNKALIGPHAKAPPDDPAPP